MPSVGSGTYAPGPNMVCSPEQEKVRTGSIEAIIYPVYSDLRIRATVFVFVEHGIAKPHRACGSGNDLPPDVLPEQQLRGARLNSQLF
jgi:hypothetical protein